MPPSTPQGSGVAVCLKAEPGLPKYVVDAILLIENYDIAGDYFAGKLVLHHYLAKKDPAKADLRQVLRSDTSILSEVAHQAIHLELGMLGENFVLDGIDLMSLGIGTQLEVGESLIELTEVHNPCYQLKEMHSDLHKAKVSRVDGQILRNAGMMARMPQGGWVRSDDLITVYNKPLTDHI